MYFQFKVLYYYYRGVTCSRRPTFHKLSLACYHTLVPREATRKLTILQLSLDCDFMYKRFRATKPNSSFHTIPQNFEILQTLFTLFLYKTNTEENSSKMP